MARKIKRFFFTLIEIVPFIVWVFPFYIIVVNAFKSKKEMFTSVIAPPASLNLTNFIKAMQALNFRVTLTNSIVITVAATLLILVCGALAGYALQRTKTKASTNIFYLFLAAMLVPFQSVMIPLVTLMSRLGLLLSRHGLILMYLGFGCSMVVFLVHGALGGIPTSMDEAAKIDGCNPLQIFFRVILPMLKPVMVTAGVLNVIWIWNDYLLPSLVINRDDLHTIPLKLFYFFGEYNKQWNLALAGLVLALVPVIIFYFCAQKQIIQGITDGAVK